MLANSRQFFASVGLALIGLGRFGGAGYRAEVVPARWMRQRQHCTDATKKSITVSYRFSNVYCVQQLASTRTGGEHGHVDRRFHAGTFVVA